MERKTAKKKRGAGQNRAGNGRNWRPSSKQIAIAELLLNPEDRRTKKDKIASIGLPERTFYKWMKDSRFINYLNSRLDEYTNGELPEIWKAFLMQCKRGNMEAIKFYFKVKELDPEIKLKRQMVEKETGNQNQEQGIKIVDDIK
jgi:hypothetical protein